MEERRRSRRLVLLLRWLRQEAEQEVETEWGGERSTYRTQEQPQPPDCSHTPSRSLWGTRQRRRGYTRLIPGRKLSQSLLRSDPTWRDVSRCRRADEGSSCERRSSSSSGDLSCYCGGCGQGSFSLQRDRARSYRLISERHSWTHATQRC